MKWLRYILSLLYGVGSWIRNRLYDGHVLHSFQSPLPSICVGNLAVGGTGKTPHVEYLVRLLTGEGYKVAVLSRGYKRKTVGFVEADEHSTAATIGDEALQIKQKFPNLIVAVCEDRHIGIRRLRRRHPHLQCVLLDDAFQHRRLKPGLSVLLTQADRLYVEDQLLPLGRLRESADGAFRADVVVVTKCPDDILPIDQRIIDNKLHLPPSKTLVFSRMRYMSPVPVFADVKLLHEATFAGKTVLLVTGIAQPHYLLEYVRKRASYVQVLSFGDHHAFTEADIQLIQRTFRDRGCQLILTTEKDAVRLRECASFPGQLKQYVYSQPIETEFINKDQQTFNSIILHYVQQSTKDR